ncbi:MAG: cation-efflux pump [Acidobacteria bacterium]|nr:cation-efflux pump [Acidobacteriota bacterium]
MENQVREKRIVAATSVIAAVFLTAGKLIVGFLTGSLGILAEAAHSALDLAAAVITFFAVRMSDRPADECHLYGHGKVENLSALAETLLLLLTCVWVIYEAVNRLLFKSVDVDPSFWAFLIMGISIVVDISRSRALSRVAKKYNSQALEADALHFSTDIWSSAVVIIGLALVRFGESRGGDASLFARADAVAALIVAGIVIFVSLRLGKRTVDALLDRAPSGLAEQVARSVGKINGIQRVSQTRVRNAGNRMFVDLTVDVPRHLSFEESHRLAEQAQETVRSISPNADVVVHAEPVAETEGILETIQTVAAREHLSVHNITTHSTDRGMWIDLDLEVDPNLSFERAHEQATNLEISLRSEIMASNTPTAIADINVHIEPRGEESAKGIPLSLPEADRYVQKIKAIGLELKGSGGAHQVELHEMGGRIYLSLHLLINAGIPIAEAHILAEEMENRLRHEFPELGRVVIHTEPS